MDIRSSPPEHGDQGGLEGWNEKVNEVRTAYMGLLAVLEHTANSKELHCK